MHPVITIIDHRDGARPGHHRAHRPRQLPHAVLHAGGHPRRDQVPQRSRLRAPRRRDRARQHLPPHAAARRRDGGAVRWHRSVRRLARAHAHRQRWVPGVLARTEGRRRRRDVPQHLRRLVTPVHARDRRAHAGVAGSRHPDGARRVPAAAVAAGGHPARARAHHCVGRAGQGRPPSRRPGAVRHRAGRRRARPCGPRARSAPQRSASTATASAASAWARPAPRWCRPSLRPSPTCPTIGPAT